MHAHELAYGTGSHRREPAHRRNEMSDMSHDVMELGKVAVGGMVTVGVVGALGGMIGGMQK
jgi:hypothetical protein